MDFSLSLNIVKENEVHITINDFLSLKKVDFSLKKGINVIAGLNGSGKSQY